MQGKILKKRTIKVLQFFLKEKFLTQKIFLEQHGYS